MKNFVYHIPTEIYFGKGQIENLASAILKYGSKVLLVYGGASIKKIGLYDHVINILADNGIKYFELPNIEPNPRVTSVSEGVKICRDNDIEVILPVGGGSVIDCAKLIAAGSLSQSDDMWGIVTGTIPIKEVLPIIAVLTLSATGTEMDTSAIITNLELQEKTGPAHPGMRPKVSILDPEYTFSVSKYQTASGVADIMSHALEVYFNNNPGAYLQNRFAEAVLKTCIKYGHKACTDPYDYEARANLMWAGSWAINGLLSLGNPGGWSVHLMEHELSAHYDTPHGVGLAVLIPHWLQHMQDQNNTWKYIEYGINVWGIDKNFPGNEIASLAIQSTAQYFKDMGLPTCLRELNIDERHFEKMAGRAGKDLENAFVPMGARDVLTIYHNAL